MFPKFRFRPKVLNAAAADPIYHFAYARAGRRSIRRRCTPRPLRRCDRRSGGSPSTASRQIRTSARGLAIPNSSLFWEPHGPIPVTRRAWAKFQAPGRYATTITQPSFFRRYLLEQLRPLVHEYGAVIDVAVSDQEMPYPYALDAGR